MQDVLKYPLGYLPWFLATSDGELARTTLFLYYMSKNGKQEHAENISASTVCTLWNGHGRAAVHQDSPQDIQRSDSLVFQMVKLASYN